jgi:hypothetical protein
MLNVAILHKVEKTERRMKRKQEINRFKQPEQRVKEREFHLDERFHARVVTRNKGRSREKQDLRKYVEVLDDE